MRPALTFPIAAVLVAAALTAAPRADPSSQARGATPAPVVQNADEPWPDAKTLEERRKSAENRRLFDDVAPLPITIAADFRTVQRDRDPKSTKTFPAMVEIPTEAGGTISVPIQIRTRGHSRRLRQTCDFAPLRLEFPKEQVRKTVFDGHGPLKLGTHCRSVTEFEQYVLREYTVYKMYNLLTPFSFRARLAKVTYVDTVQKKTVANRYGVFIEDDDDVAKRSLGRITERQGMLFHNVHPETVTLMTLFEYMIGNTDMSIAKQHNVRIVQTQANNYTVPYDFDYSGLVDTAYAVPDTKQFGIQSVRDRLYRGPCKSAAEFEPFFARFRSVKPDIMALFDALPDMAPAYRKDAQRYLEEFYRTIERPGSVKTAFIDNCDNRRGM
jgi:hypothetical protein